MRHFVTLESAYKEGFSEYDRTTYAIIVRKPRCDGITRDAVAVKINYDFAVVVRQGGHVTLPPVTIPKTIHPIGGRDIDPEC